MDGVTEMGTDEQEFMINSYLTLTNKCVTLGKFNS